MLQFWGQTNARRAWHVIPAQEVIKFKYTKRRVHFQCDTVIKIRRRENETQKPEDREAVFRATTV